MKTENQNHRPASYWKTLTALLCLGWIILWIYRSMLTPIYPQVMQTLDLHNHQQIGMIASIYFFVYVLLQVPAGIVSDKLDKRLILSLGFFVFAFATFLMSIADRLYMVYVASALAGLSGAFYYGAAYSLSGQEIPSSKRNFANAIINSGSSVGMVIGISGSSWLVLAHAMDWQVMLKGFSLLILLTFAIYFLIIRSDKTRPVKEETSVQVGRTDGGSQYFTLKKIAVYFVSFCSCYAYYLVVAWLPNFLQTERGFSGSAAGLIASLVGLASIPGALVFSVVVDKYHQYKNRIMFLLLLFAAAMLLLSAHALNSSVIMVGLVGYGLLGKLALDPLLISTISDLSNKKKLATSLSIFNFFGMTASFIAPWLTGAIADRNGSIMLAFNFAGVVLVLGAVVLTAVFLTKKKSVTVDSMSSLNQEKEHNRSQYEY